jgi:hypothetical protein
LVDYNSTEVTKMNWLEKEKYERGLTEGKDMAKWPKAVDGQETNVADLQLRALKNAVYQYEVALKGVKKGKGPNYKLEPCLWAAAYWKGFIAALMTEPESAAPEELKDVGYHCNGCGWGDREQMTGAEYAKFEPVCPQCGQTMIVAVA